MFPIPHNKVTNQRTIGPVQSLGSAYWISLLYCSALWRAYPSRITDKDLHGQSVNWVSSNSGVWRQHYQ